MNRTAHREALWHWRPKRWSARWPTTSWNRWSGLRPVGVPSVFPGWKAASGNRRSHGGKRVRAVVGATVGPIPLNPEKQERVGGVIIQTICVNGRLCKGLIDTGCSRSIISPRIKVFPDKVFAHSRGEILSFNGQTIPHEGKAEVTVEMAGRKVTVWAIRYSRIIAGADIIIGMDVL